MKIFHTILIVMVAATVNAVDYLSPVGLAVEEDGRTALVINATGKSIMRVSLPDGKVLKSRSLKREPSGIVLSENGDIAYVTVGRADGEIYAIDTKSLKIKKRADTGHTPVSPVLSPDGSHIYVCNRMNNNIARYDTADLKLVATIPVVREPFAADITPDGKLLFVANHIPAGRADVKYVACKVSVIDTQTNKVIKHIKLVNGAEGMRGIRVSPDGKYVYATHLMARFLVPTTQIERGWINTNAMSAIRVSDLTLVFTILLDDVDMGFANPWGIAIDKSGTLVCVASAGCHELTLIDLKALMQKSETESGRLKEEGAQVHLQAHNDLSFLSGIRSRVPLKGKGPREIAIHENNIYVTEYFSDSLGRVVVEDGKALEVDSFPLGKEKPMTIERRGEMLFNDATICFQKWQSCASCHPDVRTDALNWDLLNDGIGNPKNVKSLLLSHQTAPVMALGVRSTAEVAVRAGIKYIQFAVRPEDDAKALDKYISSLEPDPSPYLVRGKLSKSAKSGKIIYEEAGCAVCHPDPLFTDLELHEVGTGKGVDAGKAFDTPTLVEVWRTAPYMHDGRYATMREVIEEHPIKSDRMIDYSKEQLEDLVKYVLSL